MKQSKQLSKFYKDIWAWILRDTPEDDAIFSRSDSLCFALYKWCEDDGGYLRLSEEMDAQFVQAKLSRALPFNMIVVGSYKDECRAGTLYENQERLAWIKEHAA